MTRTRAVLVLVLLRATGWNLRLLATVIRWSTGREHAPAATPLHLPVETVTQQLRTIDTLMRRISPDR